MYFVDLLFALVAAILMTSILLSMSGFRREAAGESGAAVLLFFFLLVFFATWAGGLWVAPFGPLLFGRSWLPFLIVGAFVALLLAAAIMPTTRYHRHHRLRYEQQAGPEETVLELAFFGLAFWILLAAAAAVIALAYKGLQ